jgi:hypothetical protein
MIIDTLTFSNKAEGWTSRWSYRPEWMIGLNSTFYSFKGGNLYQHDTNQTRTLFYQYEPGWSDPGGFSITTIVNESPVETKMFKSLNLDCTNALDVLGSTDLDQVQIDSAQFSKKEGDFFAYIRRPQGQLDLDLLSVQGVGLVSSVSGLIISFNVPISNINPGDFVYKASNISGQITNIMAVGTINQAVTSSTTSSISIVGGFVNTPNPGDYIFINKKSSVESYGARGRYLNLTLSLDDWEAVGEVELFAVKTSVFKSFP